MTIFCKYDGAKGGATKTGFTDAILLNSVQWGAGRSITLKPGMTNEREGSNPSLSEVSITKEMDASSPKLFMFCCGLDAKGKNVSLHWLRSGGEEYLTITLSDTMVSGYTMTSSGDRPLESISLNYTKIEYKYSPSQEGNDAGGPDVAFYDMTVDETG